VTFITARTVSQRFTAGEGEVVALSDVSLELEQGRFVSLVGPSGCGKSTLLRIVAGLIRPTAGTVEIEGERVIAPRRDVGIVFQSGVLLPWRSVIDNVLLPVDVAKRPRTEYRQHAEELLDLVGLAGFGDKYPWQLSGGMQQRVAICRALVLRPSILLMDEPFGALDAITREEMGVEVLRIWEEVGATVLFITHSIPEALFLSDEVAVMSARPGRIMERLHVPLERPRSLDVLSDPTFNEMAGHVRQLIESQHARRRSAIGDRPTTGPVGGSL
jgi:NitT/TauT family transport system ATP-binding protein